MRERKAEKPKAFRELSRVITEIQATRGRNAEHFIKIFRHESDNVVGASLGVLLGVFEIDDQSEDSRYIVNFLFSVAKNEYFCNPRRGAMESFEAALHKINVALAEIVKHGNVDWLGKFHGTIAIIEKNSIHLSATGDGRIYLFRNGTLSHISEGLSSPDAAEHPIKTFIEISSGRLAPDDRLMFFLPQLFSLIDEETIERQAKRMDKDRFVQFLRTVMVNELDRSGAIIVDINEPTEPANAPAEELKKQPEIKSYFSETAFETKREESVATALSEEWSGGSNQAKPDYIDAKTGHIYIQGEEGNVTAESSRFAQYLEDFFHSSRLIREQGTHAARRYFRNLAGQIQLFCIVSLERLRQSSTGFFKKNIRSLKAFSLPAMPVLRKTPHDTEFPTPYPEEKSPANTPTPSAAASVIAQATPRVKASFSQLSQAGSSLAHHTAPFFRSLMVRLRTTSKTISQSLFVWARRFFISLVPIVRSLYIYVRSFFSSLPIKIRITILIAMVGILGGSFWLMFRSDLPHEPAVAESVPPVETEADRSMALRSAERLTADLPIPENTRSYPDTVAATYLNGTLVIATRTTIEIPSLSISAVLPAESGVVRSITPMPDLRTLFILTESNKLLAFTPTNKAFSENTLPTDISSIHALGAYLTYLYTLDSNNGQIYRFPRAQGGFGEGLTWLRPAISPDKTASLSVNDMVYVFTNGSLRQFSRGKEVRTFEMPHTVPTELILASEPDNTRIIGIDNTAHRLIVWNTEGAIEQQYFSNELSNIQSVSLRGQHISLSTDTQVSEIILP